MEIDEKIEDAFEVLNQINEVKVSASFKQKVLKKATENEDKETIVMSWFTPQFQLVAMIMVLLVNVSVIMYTFSSSSSETSINSFAQEYNLSTIESPLIN